MFKKKNGEQSTNENQKSLKSNFFLTHLMNLVFDSIKHAVKDFQNTRKVNKIDKFEKEFSTIEHLVIKLEEKLKNTRLEIEHLKNMLLWQNIVIIALLITIIFQLVR